MAEVIQIKEPEVEQLFNELLVACEGLSEGSDIDLVKKAFYVAYDAHKGSRRKSGEPFIIHPLSVAKIVRQDIGLGAKSVAAALLHDIVEDTDYTIEDIKNNFGDKIASLIDGLTKISGVFDQNSSIQAENFRKMLLTLSDDVRVIFIKLADRLHNMRTLDSMPERKRIKISGETIYLYAPLAHRLGLYRIKTELEDLSLKYHYPEVYDEINGKILDSEKRRVHFINKFSLPIIEKLNRQKIKFDISGRPKSIYSIWHKMQTKHVPFEEIYDLFAIRIVFTPREDIPEKTQCWNIYSMVTDIYKPKPERIRDWVSTPKANGYEALHATVMGPNGKWVEVQIRTTRMDEIAERGYAAHWRYKSPDDQESELDKWIKKIRDLLQKPSADALEFLDEFKLNLFASEIFVFTPKGDTKSLPINSTALDLAYEIHSEIGNKAIGAKVNHKLVPLNTKLNSGDQVEILTSDKQKSQIEWLDYVITAKAKASINHAFKAETKNRREKGKQELEEKLKELKLYPSSRIFRKILPAYEVISKDELYSKIGSGIINLNNLKKILKTNTKSKWIKYWELQFARGGKRNNDSRNDLTSSDIDSKSTLLLKENLDEPGANYVIAKCCNPIPGDDVIGFDSEGQMEIHKTKCPIAIQLFSQHGDKITTAKWTTHKVLSFLARINISGIDRYGMFSTIINVITKELKVNIRSVNIASHDGIFDGTLDLYVHNTQDLNNLILNLIKIKGIESVNRVESIE
ncbi:MAG: bifunctional (p)ppGpp synthetase/guanosine-3',5'-bis(diphosphate) 3'-pyrophosphohydrolase [Bacteroidales bacterium]|nr:bifunctional (p)ppGpp synthetase/guanosine-3',5'-bis(diphosphate) 3'-pyrophosphohydrolase [Bacteroidales bacterium]